MGLMSIIAKICDADKRETNKEVRELASSVTVGACQEAYRVLCEATRREW